MYLQTMIDIKSREKKEPTSLDRWREVSLIDFVSVITLEHGMCTVSLVIYLVKSVQQ